MTSSTADVAVVQATCVEVTADALSVTLSDGRTVSVPIGWYPRLAHGTPEERQAWRLVGGGRGMHWPLLDEDVSVENLLSGKPSGESQKSYARWLAGRLGPRAVGG